MKKNIATAAVSIVAIICDIMWSPFYREGFMMIVISLIITVAGILSFRGLLAVISKVWDCSPIGGILMAVTALGWGGAFIHISMVEEYSMMVIGMMFLTPNVILLSLMLFFPFVAPAFL